MTRKKYCIKFFSLIWNLIKYRQACTRAFKLSWKVYVKHFVLKGTVSRSFYTPVNDFFINLADFAVPYKTHLKTSQKCKNHDKTQLKRNQKFKNHDKTQLKMIQKCKNHETVKLN